MDSKRPPEPDTEGTAPPARPRRIQSNRQRSSKKRGSARLDNNNRSGDPNAIRTMKQQQNDTVRQSKERLKMAEEAAAGIAKEASLRPEDKQSYDSKRWEELVSKQEELMKGSTKEEDSKPKSTVRPMVAGDAAQSASERATIPAPISASIPRPPEQVLPGAFRMRPTLAATPAEGLEDGDPADQFPQDSRRTVIEKEDTIRDADDPLLIEAQLVKEIRDKPIYPEPELIMGEPVSLMKPITEEDSKRSRRRKWILVAICLLITFLIVAGAIVVVSATRKDTENSSTEFPSMAPTSFTQTVLPAYTQETLNNPASPQSKAYNWLQKSLQENYDQDMESFFPLQRFALATLFYALQGSSWKSNNGWLLEGVDPCDYFTTFSAVICTAGRRRNLRTEAGLRQFYQRFSLWQNNLAGTIPPEIGLLTKLDMLELHGNAIGGPIPSQMGLLQDVTFVQMFNNSLTGTLPTELGQLVQIKDLNFAFNRLKGTIPVEIFRSSSTLEVFSVSNNRVTGTIPSEVGLLTNLEGLHLYGNLFLSGTIPSEVGALVRLKKLHLQGIVDLYGTLPVEIGKLTLLQELQLEDTNLQGPIPSMLGSLSQLSKLTLHNTQFTGSIPQEVCALMQAGTLKVLSVDCQIVQCPAECQCQCADSPPPQVLVVASSTPVVVVEVTDPPIIVVEAITDPPITVSEAVGPTPTDDLQPTSAAVGGTQRPRPTGT